MKIVVLTMEFPTGIKTNNYSIIETCNYLSSHGYDVYLLGPKSKRGDINENFTYIKTGIGYYRFLLNKAHMLLFNLDYIIGCAVQIRKICPDLIVCNGAGSFLYLKSVFSVLYSKLIKIPCIIVWIGTDLLSLTTKFNKLLKKYVLSHSTVNMVQSTHMKNYALGITQKAKPIVIPNKGVDLGKFKNKEIQRSHQRKQDYLKLLYIGRNVPVKGTTFLLKAFIEIQKEFPNIYLDIVGINSDEALEFKDILQENSIGNIRFIGQIPHEKITDFYNHADIFVLPSLVEGLSNVLMESMASNLPIIATNVGGNKELVKNGKGGYLVPSRNKNALKNAIIKLIENPDLRKKMGEYNLEAIKVYDSRTIMKKKEIVIKHLLNHFRHKSL